MMHGPLNVNGSYRTLKPDTLFGK